MRLWLMDGSWLFGLEESNGNQLFNLVFGNLSLLAILVQLVLGTLPHGPVSEVRMIAWNFAMSVLFLKLFQFLHMAISGIKSCL